MAYDPITEAHGPDVGRRFHENMKGKQTTLLNTLYALRKAESDASATLGTFSPGQGRTSNITQISGYLIRDGKITPCGMTPEEIKRDAPKLLKEHPGHQIRY